MNSKQRRCFGYSYHSIKLLTIRTMAKRNETISQAIEASICMDNGRWNGEKHSTASNRESHFSPSGWCRGVSYHRGTPTSSIFGDPPFMETSTTPHHKLCARDSWSRFACILAHRAHSCASPNYGPPQECC